MLPNMFCKYTQASIRRGPEWLLGCGTRLLHSEHGIARRTCFLSQASKRRKYAEKLLVSARALLANYEACHKAAAPQPDISKEMEGRRSSTTTPARAFQMFAVQKHAKHSWCDNCFAMCAPTVEGLAD